MCDINYSTYQRRGGVGVNWFDITVLTKEDMRGRS